MCYAYLFICLKAAGWVTDSVDRPWLDVASNLGLYGLLRRVCMNT